MKHNVANSTTTGTNFQYFLRIIFFALFMTESLLLNKYLLVNKRHLNHVSVKNY